MKKLIFESLNKCNGTLAGPAALTFHNQRYPIFGHLRTFKNALSFGARQLTIKCSKDGRIFSFKYFLAKSTSDFTMLLYGLYSKKPYQNFNQKQSVEHSGVSQSAGSKGKRLTSDKQNTDTDGHWDMSYGLIQMDNGENGRLVNRRVVFNIKLVKIQSLLLGYRGRYAHQLTVNTQLK